MEFFDWKKFSKRKSNFINDYQRNSIDFGFLWENWRILWKGNLQLPNESFSLKLNIFFIRFSSLFIDWEIALAIEINWSGKKHHSFSFENLNWSSSNIWSVDCEQSSFTVLRILKISIDIIKKFLTKKWFSNWSFFLLSLFRWNFHRNFFSMRSIRSNFIWSEYFLLRRKWISFNGVSSKNLIDFKCWSDRRIFFHCFSVDHFRSFRYLLAFRKGRPLLDWSIEEEFYSEMINEKLFWSIFE